MVEVMAFGVATEAGDSRCKLRKRRGSMASQRSMTFYLILSCNP